jgi:hypothetical protein
MTTRKTTRKPKRKGAGWAAFWNLLAQLARMWQQGRAATRTTRPARPAPARRPTASTTTRSGTRSGSAGGGGGGGARGRGGFTPVDGRPVDDLRSSAADSGPSRANAGGASSGRSGRPSGRGSGGGSGPKGVRGIVDPDAMHPDDDPFGPDTRQSRGADAGRGVPWSLTHAGEDDPWMADLQAKHGVDRYGLPIEGHPRWSTPDGQADLAAVLAADGNNAMGGPFGQDLAPDAGADLGADVGSDVGASGADGGAV